MEENMEPEEINQLLQDLRITSVRTYEDGDFRGRIADVLNGVGFHAMNDDPETILKVLRRAVDSSVCAGKNINLAANENTIPNFEDTKLRLEQLLLAERTPDRDIGNSLDDVLCRPFTQELASHDQLKSPRNIADKNFVGIKQDTHPDFVTNLIEKQFSIQWNTEGRNLAKEPDEFNFYEFCDVERLKENEEQDPRDVPMEVKTKHLKYDPRRAHVKVQLYRFCRTRPRIEYTKNQLCPPVYILHHKGWVKWFPSGDAQLIINPHFDWINPLIYHYISSHATKTRRQALTAPTLYWAVVQDRDFRKGDHLQLNIIGKTQVYVGISKNGIKGRWLDDGSSHCKMMKKCLDNVQAMTTYDPSRLEGIQLVDARIMLAKLRGEECALFVMNTYDGPQASENLIADETAQINGDLPRCCNEGIELLQKCPDWKPIYMAYGMNGRG